MSITLTPEQQARQLAEVRRAASEGRAPDKAMWLGEPRRPEIAQPQPAESDLFSANDLTLDLLPQGQEYRVPGTQKRLWIFGATSEDQELMLSWSLLSENLQPDPADPNRARLAQARLIQDLKLSQIVLCCRSGPNRSAPRIFGRQDIPALRSRLGSSVVEEIVRISGELSGNDEALGGSVRRFFTVIRAYLQTSPSPSAGSDNSPAGSLAIRTRLLSLVTRALSRGSLDAGLMSDLGDVEGLF